MNKTAQTITKRSREITASYLQFLDRHIADLVSGQVDDFMEINEIAKALFVSHQHLTDTVQKETGHHPCHFYDLKIIEQAQEMLRTTGKSVSEIARILTYDPSNFSKFFKKITGKTPGQYRQAHKK